MNKEMQNTNPQSNTPDNAQKRRTKVLPAALALAALMLIFGVVYARFAPKTTAGNKEISIEVVDDKATSQTYRTRTDAAYLRQALEETKGLTIQGTEGAYGLMVDTVNGLTADYNADGAYWAFYLNGEYCQYGVDTQPVEDGQAYQIVYTLSKQPAQ